MAPEATRSDSTGFDADEELRACLDPDYDGLFSRADALKRLKHRQGLPLVDYDGARIEALVVEYGRGIGAEPDGYWVESYEAIVECDECGYPRAERSFKANAGHHHVRYEYCPKCGHEVEDV